MAVTLDSRIDEKLRGIVAKHEEMSRQLADPAVVADLSAYRTLSKQYAQMGPLVETYATYRKTASDYNDAKDLLSTSSDADMRAMAQDEIKALEERLSGLETELKVLLLPSDPN